MLTFEQAVLRTKRPFGAQSCLRRRSLRTKVLFDAHKSEWRMQQGFVIVTFKMPPYGAEPGTCAISTLQAPFKRPSYAPSTLQVEHDFING